MIDWSRDTSSTARHRGRAIKSDWGNETTLFSDTSYGKLFH